MKRKLLVIDFETGGLNPETDALCSLAAVVLNEGFIDEVYYSLIRDHDGNLDPEAMAVNGLLPQELARAKNAAEVVEDLEQMFLRHDMRLPRRIVLTGHNVLFDIGFMKRLYRLAGAEFDVRFERRYCDTMAAGHVLEQAGRLDFQGPPSLDNLCRTLGVPLNREGGHHSKEDAVATAKCWSKMVAMMRFHGSTV